MDLASITPIVRKQYSVSSQAGKQMGAAASTFAPVNNSSTNIWNNNFQGNADIGNIFNEQSLLTSSGLTKPQGNENTNDKKQEQGNNFLSANKTLEDLRQEKGNLMFLA